MSGISKAFFAETATIYYSFSVNSGDHCDVVKICEALKPARYSDASFDCNLFLTRPAGPRHRHRSDWLMADLRQLSWFAGCVSFNATENNKVRAVFERRPIYFWRPAVKVVK